MIFNFMLFNESEVTYFQFFLWDFFGVWIAKEKWWSHCEYEFSMGVSFGKKTFEKRWIKETHELH